MVTVTANDVKADLANNVVVGGENWKISKQNHPAIISILAP